MFAIYDILGDTFASKFRACTDFVVSCCTHMQSYQALGVVTRLPRCNVGILELYNLATLMADPCGVQHVLDALDQVHC